ncbi:uncharacterized protein [Antedon mediterranea]|uniref:uncharacterized protein n=1 Tax=Antedon mediterranea TaxID=105859 RepID=UPI003AF6D353
MNVRTVSLESIDIYQTSPVQQNADINICNAFWRPSLKCHPFQYGDQLVSFESLWPDDERLKALVEVFKAPEMRAFLPECCKLVTKCGPTRLLKQLVKQKIIDVNHKLDGSTLLHLSCLAGNHKAVSFLQSANASNKKKDKNGNTPDQVCFCAHTRTFLGKSYTTPSKLPKRKQCTMQDHKTIFELVRSPKNADDLLFKLQMFQFDVNNEKDARGELLIHYITRGGLPQIGLLICIVNLLGANVESVNSKGLTPLCLAAKLGLEVVMEILICVLGANPNAYNPITKWTPLHYAAKYNHIDIISCLLRRGADMNLECGFGYRCDDIASSLGHDECRDLIETMRQNRVEEISKIAKTGNLCAQHIQRSDLFNIDEDGNTLIMAAALANRSDNLTILLKMRDCPIDAQHVKTGRTALTIATVNNCRNAIQTLLHYNANPVIKDVNGMTPLQYACKLQHLEIATVLATETRGLTGLQQILSYPLNEEVKDLLIVIRQRRQTEIVNPTLFECAITGDVKRLFCTLEEGDNVNPITGSGDWPMYMACGNGHLEVVKLLHENGGDISSQHPTTKSTVLHVACARGLVDIVKYLIEFCGDDRNLGLTPSQDSQSSQGTTWDKLDIDAVNKQGLTALQISASKGYSRLVRKLFQRGASSAVLDLRGKLYTCREFEGVQVLIETHRKNRTDRIMLAIKVDKKLKELRKLWQGKFDHNLRDRSGNTPLMVACLFGKLEALKFLLKTGIQFLEENAEDFERSMQVDRFSDSDSGTFVESTPGVPARSPYLFDTSYGETSNTDFSDHETKETFFEQGPLFTSTQTVSHEHLRGSFYNIAGPLSRIHEGTSSTFTSNRPLAQRRRRNGSSQKPYMTDTELLFEQSADHTQVTSQDIYERLATTTGSMYQPSPSSVRTASAYGRNFRQGFVPSIGNQSVVGGFQGSAADNLSEMYFGITQNGPGIYQGSMVNHLCARNLQEGSTCLHRAVECADQKRGLKALELLLDTDKLVANIQNNAGLTPLHLACQLERRLIVKKLIKLRYVDLDLRTLDGSLPEDLTTNPKIQKLVYSAREEQDFHRSTTSTLTGGIKAPSQAASTIGPSSIDFDKLFDLYEKHKSELTYPN